MRVAITGAGIAGPTLAYWLNHSHHEVVLIEAAPRRQRGGGPTGKYGNRGSRASHSTLDLAVVGGLLMHRSVAQTGYPLSLKQRSACAGVAGRIHTRSLTENLPVLRRAVCAAGKPKRHRP